MRDLMSFNEIPRKNLTYDNIKSHKKKTKFDTLFRYDIF